MATMEVEPSALRLWAMQKRRSEPLGSTAECLLYFSRLFALNNVKSLRLDVNGCGKANVCTIITWSK